MNNYLVIRAHLARKQGSAPESDIVALARQIAAQAHTGQKRKHSKDDYIIHPTRIWARLRAAGASEATQAAALLHDVIEDTQMTEKDLAALFPSEVVDFVKALTQPWSEDDSSEEKKRRIPEYFDKVHKYTETMQIKLSDIADNINDTNRVLVKNLNDYRENPTSAKRDRIKSLLKFNRNFLSKYKLYADELVHKLEDGSSKTSLDAIKNYNYSISRSRVVSDQVFEFFAASGKPLSDNYRI